MDSFAGGSYNRYSHWASKRFVYTEGVKAVADQAGAYWLIDIVATEVAPLCIKRWEEAKSPMSFLIVDVAGNKANLRLARDTDEPALWVRHIEFTDFPQGQWVFELSMDGLLDPDVELLVMLLLQEH